MDTNTTSHPTTPEQLMRTFVDRLNARDLDGLLALYEPDAVFEPAPGAIARGVDQIRDALRSFVELEPKMTSEVVQVLEGGGVALVVNEWSMSGRAPDGSPVEQGGRSADVVRRQPEGGWLVVVDKP